MLLSIKMLPWVNNKGVKRHPTIGNNVILYRSRVGNIKINDNSKIGAGAIVINNLEEEKLLWPIWQELKK